MTVNFGNSFQVRLGSRCHSVTRNINRITNKSREALSSFRTHCFLECCSRQKADVWSRRSGNRNRWSLGRELWNRFGFGIGIGVIRRRHHRRRCRTRSPGTLNRCHRGLGCRYWNWKNINTISEGYTVSYPINQQIM